MKCTKIIILVAIFFSAIILVSSEDDKRANPLLRRAGGGRAGPAAKSSTTTAAPKEENDFDDEDYDQPEDLDDADKEAGDAAGSTSTTTTEPAKKIGPIIRPFRSNEDLLNALKRRQTTAKKGAKVEKPTPKLERKNEEDEDEPAPVAVQKSSPANDRLNRRRFGGQKSGSDSDVSAPGDDSSAPAAKRPPRFNARPARSN